MTSTPRIGIVTDSTSDIGLNLAAELGISVVPLNIHFGDEVFADQVEITTDAFMQRMLASDKLPTTSQPSIGLFERTYRQLAHQYDALLTLVLSGKLSGTLQSATMAAANVADVIPVSVMDSGMASWALGLQVLRAKELADAGEPVEHITSTLAAEASHYRVLFFVETLEHLRRGGRIGKAAQLVGSLLQLRPLLTIDEGQIVPFERARTRSKAIRALGGFARDLAPLDEIVVLYNTTPRDADALAASLQDLVPGRRIRRSQLSPVIGAHIGPDVLGVVVKENAHG